MKKPVAYIDLNFERWCKPTHELIIARRGGGTRYYHPTNASLVRVANLCRNKLAGCAHPFPNGWIWLPDDYWEAK